MFVSSGVIWSRLWWNDDDLGNSNELLAGCMRRGGDAYVMASASYLCARLSEFPVRGNGEGRGGGRSSSRDTLNSGQCGADMMMWSMGLPEGRRGVRVLAGLALRRYRKLQQARFTCALTVPPL